MNVEITFETHATSLDNECGIATGWLEGELSELGRAQAEELDVRRVGTVGTVITSDLHTPERLFGHAATRWALDRLPVGAPLEEPVGPFDWQPGWRYSLRDDGGSEIAPGGR